MKHLLIILCMATLVSCGIKNKFLNSPSGTLGVPKQPTEDTSTTELIFTTDATQSETPPNQSDTNATNQLDQEETSFFNWYYTLPFIGLGILAFLVYRLKRQSMIKVN